MSTAKRALPILGFWIVFSIVSWFGQDSSGSSSTSPTIFFYIFQFLLAPLFLPAILFTIFPAVEYYLSFAASITSVLNSSVVYLIFRRFASTSGQYEVSPWAEARSVGYLTALGYIVWAGTQWWYSIVCTGKYCGFLFFSAVLPFFLLLRDVLDENVLMGVSFFGSFLLAGLIATLLVRLGLRTGWFGSKV